MEKEEESKVKKLTDYPVNKINPFMESAVEEISGHAVKKWQSMGSGRGQGKAVLQTVDSTTGEVLGQATFVKRVMLDDERFAKIYLNKISQFFELSKVGIRLLSYVLTALRPREDIIFFSAKDAMEITGYKSKATIYKGLAELVNAEILARGEEDNLFYINPLIIFNGDRIQFMEEYVRENAINIPGKPSKFLSAAQNHNKGIK